MNQYAPGSICARKITESKFLQGFHFIVHLKPARIALHLSGKDMMVLLLKRFVLLGVIVLLAISPRGADAATLPSSAPWTIYLPVTLNSGQTLPAAPSVAIPYLNVAPGVMDEHTGELSVFWFGQARLTENYSDVRMGYNNEELFVRLQVFDRRCWFDDTEPTDEPTRWDSAAIYLNLEGNIGSVPSNRSYQFLVQFDPMPNWNPEWEINRFAYQGNGTSWQPVNLPFSMYSSYTGGSWNDNGDDQGWTVIIRIPFSSLGLTSRPAQGTTWGIAAINYDRDDANGTAIAPKVWPKNVDYARPMTWGKLVFGIPAPGTVAGTPTGTTLIRQGLNGNVVSDASVGGYTICGSGTNFWSTWGDTNESFYNPLLGDFNIQNQGNIADWPCFSKVYFSFPLNQVPAGKRILSATLTLYLFGNAGSAGAEPASLIHAYTVNEPWNEQTITWNNAPYINTYITQTWVSPPPANTGFPGVAKEWDVTSAVASAYAGGQSLNLVLYSSDNWMHSGKYFVSSNTGDWNAAGRPVLTVKWSE